MSIFTSIEGDFNRFWDTHVKPFVTDDVEPLLKTFIAQFDSVFGKQAMTEAVTAVAALASGSAFGVVATELATKLFSDAKADASASLTAPEVLQIVQSALQVAKSAGNVVTPADTVAAKTIAAA